MFRYEEQERDIKRKQLLACAIDHISVVEAESEGVLAVFRVLQNRCDLLGVRRPSLQEIAEVWAEMIG